MLTAFSSNFSKNLYNFLDFLNKSTSTASIEELSNQSIQNPRNIASKEKITMPTIITPFRAKVTEIVGSSNLFTNEKFSEEVALSSGIADILTSKSSLMKSLDKDIRKSPLFGEDQIENFEEPVMINEQENSHNSVIIYFINFLHFH